MVIGKVSQATAALPTVTSVEKLGHREGNADSIYYVGRLITIDSGVPVARIRWSHTFIR